MRLEKTTLNMFGEPSQRKTHILIGFHSSSKSQQGVFQPPQGDGKCRRKRDDAYMVFPAKCSWDEKDNMEITC